MGRTIYLELLAGSRMANDLSVGGLFVNDKTLELQEQCEIIVFNDGGQLELPSKAVYLDGNGGVGLEVIGFDDAIRARITALLEAGTAAAAEAAAAEADAAPAMATGSAELELAADAATGSAEHALDLDAASELELVPEATGSAEHALDAEGTAGPAAPTGDAAPDAALEADAEGESKTLHERLRGLSLVEQIKRAKGGTVTERTLLERLYGKNVWEALLRNPALTAPEVARIARMGSLPRPMLEIILGNGGWLQVPEVRRALLSNPRLGTDQILKLLRMMTKQELKLATVQTAYSMAVRSQAKTMLKAESG